MPQCHQGLHVAPGPASPRPSALASLACSARMPHSLEGASRSPQVKAEGCRLFKGLGAGRASGLSTQNSKFRHAG